MKILIIEDSARLCRSLSAGFTQLGYTVDYSHDGAEGLNYALSYQYDAIVLDLMLPTLDGLSVLCKLRDKKNNASIIILSAKGQIDDRVKGLKLGADDYLCKPFAFEELNARITTMVRHKHGLKTNILENGNVRIDIGRREATVKDTPIALTPHEYSILEYLLLHVGNVITYESLENYLYDSRATVTKNTIEVHVSGLRKKLNENFCNINIKTRRGFGYYIEE